MITGIRKSVGEGGVNLSRDVKLVQFYLNAFITSDKRRKKLKIDGVIGPKTIAAIRRFQAAVVGMAYPDGRVDPKHKTFRYLTMYFEKSQQAHVEKRLMRGHRSDFNLTKKIRPEVVDEPIRVIYKGVKTTRQIVSNYSINVIKVALKKAGMDTAVITSTLRYPEEQASIMLRNAKKDLQAQFRLYGVNGDSVLRIYEKNRHLPDDEIVKLMVEKIANLSKQGARVSQHCVTELDYHKLNIIDIGVNSTKAENRHFDKSKFTKALDELHRQGCIDKLIDETGKSNQCWHLEISPNKRGMPVVTV